MNTRTNIVLDDKLLAKAMERAGVKTKKAAVEAALRAYVREPDYSGLLALAGTGVLSDDYAPKALFTHPRYGVPQSLSEPAPAELGPRKSPARGSAPRRPRKT